ncbi:hypothetical protein CDV36_007294 [Fusarium kuroshium]|uniref:Uncharacterized protein n=1 Tax=Fusarium kuroshium TaxID=2010991 RepID=A0A3M2S655_9HYPO|nr:hypothetical protein CDV36_007294 [Fusarium kuroshium]
MKKRNTYCHTSTYSSMPSPIVSDYTPKNRKWPLGIVSPSISASGNLLKMNYGSAEEISARRQCQQHSMLIALDDIRASGMKPFFESQSAPTYISGASTTVEMESWLQSKITHTRSYFEKTSRPSEKHEAPDPWVFRRVVVCNSQWPGDANWSNIEEAEQSISNTVDTLDQCLTRIDTHPSDPMTGDLDLARCAARQYSNRQPSPNSTFALRQRFEVGGTFHKQFNSSVVCLRCFLWLYADILSVEANILRACSGTLHMDPPRLLKVEEPSIFQKVVRFLSTTTMPIILGQVVRAFIGPEPQLIAPEPPLIAPAICELMSRSRDLCFHYRMNGNLSSWRLCLFPLTGRAEKATWLEAYRQCLESIIETEGKRLMRSYNCERIRLYET